MAPWCNRIPRARFRFQGKERRLRPNDGPFAMHGDVLARRWEILALGRGSLSAIFDSRSVRDFNYPFPLRFRCDVAIQGGSILSQLTVENVGTERAPVAIGFHPFFRRALRRDETPALFLPAVREFSEGPLPERPPFPSRRVFARRSATLDQPIDRCFETKGRAWRLTYPKAGLEIRAESSVGLRWSYVYAPERHAGRKANFVCVEPMTAAVNAFELERKRIRTGLRALRPGERVTEWVRYNVSPLR